MQPNNEGHNTYLPLIGWSIAWSRGIPRGRRGSSWGRSKTRLIGIHIAMSCKGRTGLYMQVYTGNGRQKQLVWYRSSI